MNATKRNNSQGIIGLIPAGGQATRISPLPLSKELYPIGFQQIKQNSSLRPKVVCHYLLEKMRLADIKKAFFILRPGKWDIPAYLGDGEMLDMNIGYLMMNLPHGVPYTVDQAYAFVEGSLVAFGFPDILFQPLDAFRKLLSRQAQNRADIVLGLFPADQPSKAGMVDFDPTGRVHRVIEKPQTTTLKYMWGIAVWTPTFTNFLHDYLATIKSDVIDPIATSSNELSIGDIVQAGIDQGLYVEAEVFADGRYIDIGTPEDLVRAAKGEDIW